MNFMTVNELKSPRKLKERLTRDKEILLTSNGKPMAVLLNIDEGEDTDDFLKAARMARSELALRKIREAARSSGSSQMNVTDIEKVIARVRKGKA